MPANPRYDGSDSGPIDLTTARKWVQNFRNQAPATEVRSHYFGRDIIDRILGQKGCTGIRIFYARNEQGQKELIIAGTDDTGSLMLPDPDGKGNSLADDSWPCPPICPPDEL
ncbi:MAG: hypothetical protein JNK10_07590 [Cyclobacteriaceae bacterium]|nr:hypothetical protein [Cyclobacteriaceae bacterium]